MKKLALTILFLLPFTASAITSLVGNSDDGPIGGASPDYNAGSSYTAVATGDLSIIEVYAEATEPLENAVCGVYANAAGVPGALLGATSAFALSAGLNQTDMSPSVSIVSGTVYFLTCDTSNQNIGFTLNTGSGVWAQKALTYDGTLPDPYGTPDATDDHRLSIEGYAEDAAAASPSQDQFIIFGLLQILSKQEIFTV